MATQSTSTVVTTSVHTTRIEQQHTYSTTFSAPAQAQPRSSHGTPQRQALPSQTGSGRIGSRAPASSTRRQRSIDAIQPASSIKASHADSEGKERARKPDDSGENRIAEMVESPPRTIQTQPRIMGAVSRSPRTHNSIDVAGPQSGSEERRAFLKSEIQRSLGGSGSAKRSRTQELSHERSQRNVSATGIQQASLSINVPRAASSQMEGQGKTVSKRKRGAEEMPIEVHGGGDDASTRKERKMRKGQAASRTAAPGVKAGKDTESIRGPAERVDAANNTEAPDEQLRMRATQPKPRAVEAISRKGAGQLDGFELEPLSQTRGDITTHIHSDPEADVVADAKRAQGDGRYRSRAAASPRKRSNQPRNKNVVSSIELVHESWRAISRFLEKQRATASPLQQQALTILHDLMAARQSARIFKLESLDKSQAALQEARADLQTLTDERLDLARQMKAEEDSWRTSRRRRETALALHQKALDLQHERLDADPDDAAVQERSAPATLEVALHSLQTFLAKTKLSKPVS